MFWIILLFQIYLLQIFFLSLVCLIILLRINVFLNETLLRHIGKTYQCQFYMLMEVT